MVFHADMAYATELIALASGTVLLVWAGSKENACGKAFAKIVSYFIIVVSLLTMLCTSYYTLRYWDEGYFKSPHSFKAMEGMMHPRGGDMGQDRGTMMDGSMRRQMMHEE